MSRTQAAVMNLLLVLLWISALVGCSSGAERKMTRTEFLEKLLEGYDRRVSPGFENDETTEVECDMYVSSFDTISESTMDYVISIFLRQSWHDARLSYEHLSNESIVILDSSLADSVWLPDMYFVNEKEAYFHDVTRPNRFLRLYINGTVYYSSRLSLTLSCPMKLHKFPLDTQVCSMFLESYAYPEDKLIFKWRKHEPVETAKNMELPQFDLVDYWLKETRRQYNTGIFSGLDVHFRLHRNIGYYMIQTYIPSMLVVILSWVSFWISGDATPARISLGVLTILTMTTQTAGSRQSLPRVSYIKAIDVWMAACLIFVFSALLEFAIVNVLIRKEVRRQVTLKRNKPSDHKTANGNETNEMMNAGKVRQEVITRDPFGKQKARMVDKISRKIFPLSFIVFNIVYWATYMLWNPSGTQ